MLQWHFSTAHFRNDVIQHTTMPFPTIPGLNCMWTFRGGLVRRAARLQGVVMLNWSVDGPCVHRSAGCHHRGWTGCCSVQDYASRWTEDSVFLQNWRKACHSYIHYHTHLQRRLYPGSWHVFRSEWEVCCPQQCNPWRFSQVYVHCCQWYWQWRTNHWRQRHW